MGCGIGDVNSGTSTTTTSTDNSDNNGIATCEYTCSPADGGYLVTQTCRGDIVNGPDFIAGDLPEPCVIIEEEPVI